MSHPKEFKVPFPSSRYSRHRDKENFDTFLDHSPDQPFQSKNYIKRYYRNQSDDDEEPFTSTKINDEDMAPYLKSINVGATFSTSSSLSDDECDSRRSKRRFNEFNIRPTVSTSDITTSDSSFQTYHLNSTASLHNIHKRHDLLESDDDDFDLSPVLNDDLQPDIEDESDLPPPCNVALGYPHKRREVRESKRSKKPTNEIVSLFSQHYDTIFRPDQFKLPGQLAKAHEIKGKITV